MSTGKIDFKDYKRLTIDQLNDKGCFNLVYYVLKQMAAEYQNALYMLMIDKKNQDRIKHYQKICDWFLSSDFIKLTNLDGQAIIDQLEREYMKVLKEEKMICEVLDFISHFKGSENMFLHGCCYWFAKILYDRFSSDEKWLGWKIDIRYEPVEGHFVACFYNKSSRSSKYFDIRGDVTSVYADKELEQVEKLRVYDHKRYTHLMRDCRDFTAPE